MKKSHLIALGIVAACIGYIISTSSDYSTYENFSTAYTNNGKNFQVVGNLAEGKDMSYEPEVDPNHFTFFMTDKEGETRKVIYKNPKPQDFEKTEQIVVTGHMKGEEFIAKKILMKCPSKYIEESIEDETKQAELIPGAQ